MLCYACLLTGAAAYCTLIETKQRRKKPNETTKKKYQMDEIQFRYLMWLEDES